ncbi:MAG: type II toxin-antitoxin system YoeB family toxin [Puniceicoccales bacterium]|jgi:toxin YoeB|nr:type II toxin-antitoxin system YoeB family toxin [Puniceicoccales bacterium]
MFQPEYSKQFDREYKKFCSSNLEIADKIDELKADILAHPTYRLGHPERLRHRKGNEWSRHIDKKNRLVYEIIGNVVWFERCKGHYNDH